MNLIGKKVKHRVLGEGIITAVSENTIEINFKSGIRKLQYPQTFEKFMVAQNKDVQQGILDKIKEDKAVVEAKKKEKIIEERKKEEALKEIKNTTVKGIKRVAPIKRRDGNAKVTFLVFQGDTFAKEAAGGYIWAPCFNRAGQSMHHWDRLMEVRPGDVILHSSDGEICAISMAKDKCYDCIQPKELRVDDLWEYEGRRVDCEYILIKNPIKLSSYRKQILEKPIAKYSPFNRNGKGNQGYLFDLNHDLARLFINESVKINKELLSINFIKEFVEEE